MRPISLPGIIMTSLYFSSWAIPVNTAQPFSKDFIHTVFSDTHLDILVWGGHFSCRADYYWRGECTEIRIIPHQDPPSKHSLRKKKRKSGMPALWWQCRTWRKQQALTDMLSGLQLMSPDAETWPDAVREKSEWNNSHIQMCVCASCSASLQFSLSSPVKLYFERLITTIWNYKHVLKVSWLHNLSWTQSTNKPPNEIFYKCIF